MAIHFWLFDIRDAFNGLREYAGRLEAQIERMEADHRHQLEQLEQQPLDPEEEEEPNWIEHQLIFQEALPRNLRYSAVSLLLTTIETALLQVCRFLKDERQLRLAVRDLDVQPPHKRALAYIEKVAGIPLPNSPFRSTVAHLVTVRNCIVHGAGNVDFVRDPEKAKKVRAAAQRLPGFAVLADGSVEIAEGVCAALVDQASVWIDEVIAATGLYRRPQYHG